MAVDNPSDADPEDAQMAAIPEGTSETDSTEVAEADSTEVAEADSAHAATGPVDAAESTDADASADAGESTDADASADAGESADAEVSAGTAAEASAPPPVATQPMRPAPAPATDHPGVEAARPNRRKIREGLVLSVAMDQTAVVGVIERVRHPRYAKTVQRTKRLYAHNPNNDLRVGDRVRLAETRPMSKLKRWRVVDVLERAK
jgi:small subunit ribosomal protein S17